MLFSTYSAGENRVTASFLAVLRSLTVNRIQRLLGALLEQTEFELIQFENQPSKGAPGVPDAIIQSSVRLLIETKIERNAVRAEQLRRHLDRLSSATESRVSLLVITPDECRPPQIDELDDGRIAWASFFALDQAIDELLDDKYEVISEREAFLLREFQQMLQEAGLIASAKDVAVIAARVAWPEYERFKAYVCQAERSFQPVGRIAFYADAAIQPLVPKITAVYHKVEFVKGKASGALGKLVDKMLHAKARQEGMFYKVFLLSSPESDQTLKLNGPIPNDLKTESGRTTAFVQGQRYVSSEMLQKARTTSELVD